MMMSKYERQELLERYLAGELSLEERSSLEARLSTDRALREELDIYRQAAHALNDPQRLALREILQEIVVENTAPAPRFNKYRYLLLLLIVFPITIFGWQYFRKRPDVPSPIPPVQVPSNPPPAQAPGTEDPSIPQSTPQKKLSAPIASADHFQTNASFETLINSQIRGNASQVQLNRPVSAAEFAPDEKGMTKIQFQGQKANHSQEITLTIFNNRDKNPVYTQELPMQANQVSPLHFDLILSLPLKPGLYYYLLEETASGEMAGVGKFTVK